MVNKSDAKEKETRRRKTSTSDITPVKVPKDDVYAVNFTFLIF